MDKPTLTMAEQIAQAASTFQQQRTGHVPSAVTVVLSEDTLVITLHGALSPAEKALAKTPEGAVKVQDFHRQLFASSAEPLRHEMRLRLSGPPCGAASRCGYLHYYPSRLKEQPCRSGAQHCSGE